jgi:excisionase family DNA binding protein
MPASPLKPEHLKYQEVYSPRDIVLLSRECKTNVYEAIHRGDLPAYRSGKAFRIEREHALAWMESLKHHAGPDSWLVDLDNQLDRLEAKKENPAVVGDRLLELGTMHAWNTVRAGALRERWARLHAIIRAHSDAVSG